MCLSNVQDGCKHDNVPQMKQSLFWGRRRALLSIWSRGFLPARLFSCTPKLVDQMKASQVEERAVLEQTASPGNCNAASVLPGS